MPRHSYADRTPFVTKVLLATLLANDTDPENDPLSINAAGSAQPDGATVVIPRKRHAEHLRGA